MKAGHNGSFNVHTRTLCMFSIADHPTLRITMPDKIQRTSSTFNLKINVQIEPSILKVGYLETPTYTPTFPIIMFGKNKRTSSTYNFEGWLP